MGKRELLLVVCFLIVGAVVYQATAPPPDPSEPGFSFSKLVDHVRREVRGNRAVVELTTTGVHALPPEITELRLVGPIAELDVTGEERGDAESTFFVNSRAYTDAEAAQYAKESKVVEDRAGSALILRVEFPRGGRQRGTLKVKVPARLRVRVEPGASRLTVTNVAGVEIAGTRGEATVRQVTGRVEISHRGGPVVVDGAGSIEFNGRGGSLRLTSVRGDSSIRMDGGGEINTSGLGGAVEMECRNTEITLDKLEGTRGPIRVNIIDGNVTLKGLKAETRIDGRDSTIRVEMSGPAPVAIYNVGDRVEVTPPPGPFTLDARVIDGHISPDTFGSQAGLKVNRTGEGTDNEETRLAGSVKGGGPTITIRATRGDLTFLGREESAKPSTQ